jgi:pimeloyl-[acyl-carrier protein] methyl ester esterase
MPTVVLSDDFRMAYREQGAGRPLLLVHGWGAHSGFFQPQLDGLSDRFRVIAVDLRGHGDSRIAPGAELSTALLARDLGEFIAALDLNDIVAVGWSMGAMVLWQAWLDGARSRIARMVVEDMSPRIVNEPGWGLGMRKGFTAKAAEKGARAMVADWPAYARALARNLVSAGPRQEALVAWAEQEFLDQEPRPLARLWSALAHEDFRGRLPEVTAPTLVIHGRYGPYEAETARWIEDALPTAASLHFERSGHAPHLEEPERFNRVTAEFAQQPAGRAAAPGLAPNHA